LQKSSGVECSKISNVNKQSILRFCRSLKFKLGSGTVAKSIVTKCGIFEGITITSCLLN